MAIIKKKGNEAAKKDTQKKPRKSPLKYFKDVWAELKRVTWPTRKELTSYSVAVVVFIVVMACLLFVMDSAFGYVLELILTI